MSPKSITNTYVLTLLFFVLLLITRHDELGALITGHKCPESENLPRNTERVADVFNDLDLYNDLDDGGSGEEMEQERMALENDADEPTTSEPQIITGLLYLLIKCSTHFLFRSRILGRKRSQNRQTLCLTKGNVAFN